MEIKISQFCALMLMIMFSCFIGILDSSCFNIAGVDSWMIPIVGCFIGLPILFIYLYVYNNMKNINLNELIIKLFGNFLGRIIAGAMLLFAISFTMVTFWNLTSFVASQYLYDTPQWFIDIIFIITIYYIFSKNERTILRASLILFYIVLLFYFISFIGLTDKINVNNIKPILEHGMNPIFKSIFNYISYTILPIFTLSIIARNKVDNKNLNKWIIITYFIGHFLIFSMLFLLISVFGINLTSLYQYPAYHLLKRVFVGGFVERLENVLSLQYIIVLLIPCAFSNFYCLESIKSIFNINKNKYIYPILMFIMFISQYIFQSNTFGEKFFITIYPIFMGSILITIPCIVAIKLFIDKKIKRKFS